MICVQLKSLSKVLRKRIMLTITILVLSLIQTPVISSGLAQPIKIPIISHIVGKEDYSLLVPPQRTTKEGMLLFVYLHGLANDCHEPFNVPPFHPIVDSVVKKYPRSLFLSAGYGEASWGDESSLEEITNNIREISKRFTVRQIIMIGSSMGGGVALTYAARAPRDIKEKIVGVVAFSPAGDTKVMYDLSKHYLIKPSMVTAFGGTPAQVPQSYRKASFLYNLSTVDPALRVCIVSIKRDAIHPEILQEQIVSVLKNKNIPVVWFQVRDNQPMPPIKPYMQGLSFILNTAF